MAPLPRVGLARVRGRSMAPTLRDGDRLVVLWGVRPRRGQIVLVELPDGPDGPRPLAVKRLTRLRGTAEQTTVFVEGDNLAAGGVDSWTVGDLPAAAVRAVALARLPRSVPRPGWRQVLRSGDLPGRAARGVRAATSRRPDHP